jgi:hypothetical protein
MKKQFFLPLLALAALLNLLALGSQAQTGTQTVRGRVVDAVAQAPIIGANVVVVPPPGQPPLGAATDVNGDFKIVNVPVGRQTLKISFIGYEEITLPNVVVTAGKEVILNFALTENVNQLNEVVVEYDRSKDKTSTNNELISVSARSFNIDDTKRYAGALGDPSRMAANFAGVVSGNDSRNDIVVRGNSPSGMLWQLEGLNIPNPNHFGALGSTGGPVSMLNNNVLAKSDFITSAFPAQYGNATAGAFDLRLRNGNNERREFLGQIGFNGFEVGAEGPFAKGKKASYLVNYRYSTLGLMQNLGINFGTGNAVPYYQDLNFKVNAPVGKKGRFFLFGLGGASNISFLGNKADTTQGNNFANENENTIVNYRTGVLGAGYEYNLSPRTFVKLTLGASGTEENFRGDSISVITREEFQRGEARFTTQKYSVVGSVSHKFNAKHSLTGGFYVDLLNFNLFNREIFEGGAREQVLVNITDQNVLTQGHAQWKFRASQRLTFNTGLHAQHYSLTGQAVVEPRLGLRYLAGRRSTLSLGYGLHSQAPSVYTSYVLTPQRTGGAVYTNRDLGFTRSHHVVLGYEANLSDHLLLKAEAYYQSLFAVPVERRASSFSALNTGATFGPSEADSLVNTGTGRNYGLELTLERYFHKGYYFLVTTSLFNSQYTGSDGVERNTAFNTNYVLNVLAGKEWKVGRSKTNVLVFNVRATTVGGRYFTPLNLAASRAQGQAVYDEARAFSERQTPYFRADLRLAYRKEYKRSTLEFALDLQNVSNNQNIFQQAYNRRTNRIVNEYQQGFFPVPFVRYTF